VTGKVLLETEGLFFSYLAAARKAYPPENALWIYGGSVGEEEDIWSLMIDQLQLFQASEITTTKWTSRKFTAGGSAEANFLVVAGGGRITVISCSRTLLKGYSASFNAEKRRLPQ